MPNIERERKFVLSVMPAVGKAQSIEQYYLVTGDTEVSIRKFAKKHTLRIKTGGPVQSRGEFEFKLSKKEFDDLKLAAISRVIKDRHTLEPGITIDNFGDLFLLEVEHPAKIPNWVLGVGKEVTGDPDYYNANLAKPFIVTKSTDKGWLATCSAFPQISVVSETEEEALSKVSVALEKHLGEREKEECYLPKPEVVLERMRLNAEKAYEKYYKSVVDLARQKLDEATKLPAVFSLYKHDEIIEDICERFNKEHPEWTLEEYPEWTTNAFAGQGVLYKHGIVAFKIDVNPSQRESD